MTLVERERDREMTLIERERELTRLDALISDAAAGRGSMLVLEGPPGIGKTALLDHTRANASTAGLQVLTARAAGLESDLGFSLVRGMFEPVLARLPVDERDALLSGAARLARGPLGIAEDSMSEPVELGSALHGIYWLCANLAERQPMLLAIDDLHWADEPSLHFLTYLARRVSEHPLAICVSTRPVSSEPAARFLSALGADPGDVLRLDPLSDDGVDQLVRTRLSDGADPAFVDACARVSGGNPFLLVEALDAMRSGGVEPTAGAAERIGELRADTLARSLLTRISRLGPDAGLVASAVAILGSDAQPAASPISPASMASPRPAPCPGSVARGSSRRTDTSDSSTR